MNEGGSLSAEPMGKSKLGRFGQLKGGQYGKCLTSQCGTRRRWGGKQVARSGLLGGTIPKKTFTSWFIYKGHL